MQMSKLHIALLALMLGGSIIMTACTPKDATSEHEAESSSLDSKDGSDLKDKTEAKAIKNFPATPDDTHDIGLLTTYQTQFDSLSHDLETELQTLEKDNNLTEDMKSQRKHDLIKSSLNMLKELDLKTEQGRYIQGLYYQYWENQAKVYQELKQSNDNELANPTDAIEGMSDYYTAQAQLEHWQQQTAQ